MDVFPNSTLTRFPAGFHENDELRSQFIRALLLQRSTEAQVEVAGASGILKVLVRFWHDAQAVPYDVAECLQSWLSLRDAGFEIVTFDDASASDYIAKTFGPRHVAAFERCNHPAMRSDYFRLCYVLTAGGFYVDADDVMTEGLWSTLYEDASLKLQPLCYEIPSGIMIPVVEIWDPDIPTEGRIFYVNNNPLVAPPGHPIIRRALERATSALLKGSRPKDIQSTTGPGNLTAALAAHARELALEGLPRDFELMRRWDRVAETRWDLSYRADKRNWRNVVWS
ncbi:glycosyltransferase family 32 protein [Dongia soli]|uniref:Glycosyl transferase-like sugar-binding protein n=1 Tax=Dongia soli TaxID=600628 RepID=A0ABU5EEX5_9PROT|nr:glycosyltransferase [Dongia soli]MDY0884090.1 hypothetical protein [Dongia soli]